MASSFLTAIPVRDSSSNRSKTFHALPRAGKDLSVAVADRLVSSSYIENIRHARDIGGCSRPDIGLVVHHIGVSSPQPPTWTTRRRNHLPREKALIEGNPPAIRR